MSALATQDVDVLFDDDSTASGGGGDQGRPGMTILTGSNNVVSGNNHNSSVPGGGYHKVVNPQPHDLPPPPPAAACPNSQQVYLLQQQQHSPVMNFNHHHHGCCVTPHTHCESTNYLPPNSPQDIKLRRNSEPNEFHHICGCYDSRVTSSVCHVMSKVSYTIDRSEKRHTDSDQRDQTECEWKQVAMVIDRFLLLIFFLAMTIASLVILTSSPHISGAKIEIDMQNIHK